MEIGSLATQVWDTIENAYQNLLRGAVQSTSEILLEVEKSIERQVIRSFYAPAKLAKRSEAIQKGITQENESWKELSNSNIHF